MSLPLILVIEDNSGVRENLVDVLSAIGFESAEAEDGVEGLRKIKELQPDLVLCDWLMPNLTGLEVLQLKEKDPEIASIPFIFLTAKADLTSIKEALIHGADSYLTKPYAIKELVQVINAKLDKRYRTQERADNQALIKLRRARKIIENEYGNLLNSALCNVQLLGERAPFLANVEEFNDLKMALAKGAITLPRITRILEGEKK